MPKILELPRHVADMIAAGEVVERPASVVKELFENAVDAGADAVTIEIKNGGMSFIRVSDNGCGISREDARNAFLRHATSKLRDEAGLEAIGTLGFRGEALAAIASVSRIEMTTRAVGDDTGTSLCLDGGAVIDESEAARPEGTSITVRDLFYNTPARLKFMKTDRAEGASVTAAVLRCALSRPDISVRYVRDGTQELHTPGDNKLESCIYSALGREASLGLLPVSGENDGVAVTGYISKISALRGNRANQYFFVNGRFVRSKTMQAALEQAYKNSMFTGRFPQCVLFLALAMNSVDVNVHPAKTEVKFLREKQVFDCVYYACLGALAHHGEIPGARVKTFDDIPAEPARETVTSPRIADTPADDAPRAQVKSAAIFDSGGFVSKIPSFPERTRLEVVHDETQEPYVADNKRRVTPPDEPAGQIEYDELIPSPPEHRVIGEAFSRYIVVESGESLWLIDKHAAHERIHFDRLKNEETPVMIQTLLTPVVISPGGDGMYLLLESAALLERMGFTVEPFGEGSAIVRQLPSDIDISDAESVLSDICEALSLGGVDEGRRRDEAYASVACKAAIKSGRDSDYSELVSLAASVMRGDVQYCPHGRPVKLEVTKSFLDKGFRRI